MTTTTGHGPDATNDRTPSTIEEYRRQRGISDDMLADARRRTEEYVHAYELKEARKKRHLTQIQVALRMKVSQKRISELESGDIGHLRLSTLRRYAEALGGRLRISVELPEGTIPLAG